MLFGRGMMRNRHAHLRARERLLAAAGRTSTVRPARETCCERSVI
jgi:hypothetical protein